MYNADIIYTIMKSKKIINFRDTVAVIIPAYNEGEVVGDVLNGVVGRYRYTICVNDGSSDDTSYWVLKTKAILVEHPINLGQGAALQTGIEYALTIPNIKYFVTFDADGQHSLDDVKAMIEELDKGRVDIVLGSRFLGKVDNISVLKKLVLKLAIRFSNSTSGVKLTDTHNGLRVFNRYVAENLNISMADFSHASEIIDRIAEKKFRYKEMPVTIKYTEYSRSKGQSVINAVNIGFDVILNKMVNK